MTVSDRPSCGAAPGCCPGRTPPPWPGGAPEPMPPPAELRALGRSRHVAGRLHRLAGHPPVGRRGAGSRPRLDVDRRGRCWRTSRSRPWRGFVGLVDTANGIAVRQPPGEWMFPNLDLTVHLHRQPVGGPVGLDTTVVFGPDGVGLTSSVLHDAHGAVGRAEQILTVRPLGARLTCGSLARRTAAGRVLSSTGRRRRAPLQPGRVLRCAGRGRCRGRCRRRRPRSPPCGAPR